MLIDSHRETVYAKDLAEKHYKYREHVTYALSSVNKDNNSI